MSNYYNPPSQEVFDEIKQVAISLWEHPNYGYHPIYIQEKVSGIKDIENVRDNYAFIMSQFDAKKQEILVGLLSDKAKCELFDEQRIENKLSAGFRKYSR